MRQQQRFVDRLRQSLHHRKLNFRRNLHVTFHGGSARPEFVLLKQQIAVFVNDCFHKGCPEHGRQPTVDVDYWARKIATAVERDEQRDRVMTEAGWIVIRAWEHDHAPEIADRIQEAIASRAP